MEKKDRWSGKHGQKVDLAAYAAARGKKDPEFKAAHDEAAERHNVARQLARLRTASGLSQRDLAERLHTSQAAISRLENEAYEGHSLSMLQKYAKAVGASMTIQFRATSSPLTRTLRTPATVTASGSRRSETRRRTTRS